MKLGFLLLLTCFCILGFSQDYEMRISNISDEQGIDVPSTFGIAEDPYGFIWFGTVGGLYRYDGYKMRVYRNIESDSTSLSSNTIRTLLVDTLRNKIYIGTQLGGLNIFDLNTQTFTHFMVDRTNPYSITNNSIWSLMLDEKGLLWIGMEDYQLNQFNPDDNKFYKVELQNQNPEILKGSCTIRMLYQEPNNNIWVGTDNHGLYLLEPQGFQSHFFEIYNKPNALKNNFIISACNDSKGNFWIATFGGGIAKYIAKTKVFEHVANHRESNLGPISGLAYSIIAGTDNSLWVGTEYGLSNMNTITFQANHYEQQFSSNEGLTDNRIRKLFRDSQGILWIGTEAGVDKMVTQTNFKSFQHQMGKTNSLPGGIVRAIYKDKNDALWIGLIDKGLVKYNNKTKEYTHYIDGKFVTGNIICYQVSAIFEDSKNNFWIGDWEKGLLKFDRKNQKFTNEISTFYGKNRLVDNRIQVIREDFDETLWLGTESGIARYNPTTKDIEYIVHDADNP